MKNTASEVYNISQNVMHFQDCCRYNNKREVGVNHINNDIDHIMMRRSQNTLIVVGTGTILFSVWTVVKTLGSLFMRREETIAIARRAADEIGVVISDQNLFYIMLAILLITMLLFLGIRTYIGRAAISEGRGFQRSKGYLILAVILIIINTAAVVIMLISAKSQEYLRMFSSDMSLSTLIIELTSIIMLAEMVFAAAKLRKVRGAAGQSAEQKEQE